MTAHPLSRDMHGYGEHPPVFTWPGGGGRVAVSLVINVEEGAERSIARGDSADDLGGHWLRHAPHPIQRNLDLESAFEYGARAGIWRVLRTLRRHGATATAFCCVAALEANPQIAHALVRDGHEIADHGRQWDLHTHLSPAEERERILSSADAITALTGERATTWYSRDGLTLQSRAIMLDADMLYESNSFNDDLPHAATDGLSLPVLPYAGDTNDSALLSQYPTAQAFRSYLSGALAELQEDDRAGASVLSVGLHPRIIGRPAYIRALDDFLTEAGATAWIATRAQIVDAWQAAVAA
ncbi:polysaccharide deacetylase family protein [Microbacterium keratanolyticum]|uniref:polysaccharide deacetylase family protein n=1 Tax=Microbacterium keratanolyticum TaxID=67574 RepID=UPI003625DCA3